MSSGRAVDAAQLRLGLDEPRKPRWPCEPCAAGNIRPPSFETFLAQRAGGRLDQPSIGIKVGSLCPPMRYHFGWPAKRTAGAGTPLANRLAWASRSSPAVLPGDFVGSTLAAAVCAAQSACHFAAAVPDRFHHQRLSRYQRTVSSARYQSFLAAPSQDRGAGERHPSHSAGHAPGGPRQGNQPLVRPMRRMGNLVDQRADLSHHLDIPALAVRSRLIPGSAPGRAVRTV